jgi:RNA polymerase sigma-70 factor (ECF subfamily)
MDQTGPDSLRQTADAELVRLFVAGDHDAMTVIFDRYYRLVMSVALRMLHNVTQAEDVVQIVFLDFSQKAHLFDEKKGNLPTWLLQYVYGRTINYKKNLESRHFYDEAAIDEEDPGIRSTVSTRAFNLDTPDAARLVEQILGELNDKQRMVIERVFFEGMKISEVAEQTGESITSLHHAYYRGIEKLRRFLRETQDVEEEEEAPPKKRFFWSGKAPKRTESLTGEVQIAKSRTL